MSFRIGISVFAWGLLGCGAAVPEVAGTEGSSGAVAPTGGETEAVGSTWSGEPPLPSSSSSGPSGSGTESSSSTGNTCGEVPPLENPEMWNCSTTAQDCPDCYKCTHNWSGDTSVWPVGEGTVCVPVDAEPVADLEPCTYGISPGLDNCGADSFCWTSGPEAAPYCIPFCADQKTCGEGGTCVGGGDGPLGCLPSCDPFEPDCPDPSESCLWAPGLGAPVCRAYPELPTTVGETCVGLCGSGLACISAEAYGDGCKGDSCCTAVCDAEHPCSSEAQSCLGACGEGSEDLSVCGIQPPPDPLQCPPEDAEPNYEWCSSEADECGEAFGGGDSCLDVCFCADACDSASDCPTPETGNPEVVCGDEAFGSDTCLLSCADGQTCPNGMVCDTEFYPGLCLWGVELEPGCSMG